MDESRTRFFEAVAAGDLAAVERALEDDPALAGARREDGVSGILVALYHGQTQIAERLAVARSELDPFEAAALGASARLAQLLDDDAALARAYSRDGWTPLHLAAFFGRLDAARLLLDRRASARAVGRNAMANEPIHAAAAAGNTEIVRLLLDRGADADARQHGGWTALHAAAQSGDAAIAELLVAHGADPAPSNDEGVTPADLAELQGHPDLAVRLRTTRHSRSVHGSGGIEGGI